MPRFLNPLALFSVLLAVLALPAGREVRAAGEDRVNLLRLPGAMLEETTAAGSERARLKALTDDDPATVAQVTVGPEGFVDVTYGFGGAVVTPERLVVRLPKTKPPGALTGRVEVLVSTLSAQAGFYSLRVDPLKQTADPQEFAFPPTAARWVLLRFTPAEKATRVAVAEVAVLGQEGPPVTRYAFDEAPAKAFDVLARLKKTSSLNVSITHDEAALFADVRDGRFDQWSFAEAALLASGVLEADKRKVYLQKLDTFEAQARRATAGAKTPLEKGEKLLAWLHSKDGPMAKRYVARQTDLSVLLDTGTYNCVSSATVYNVLGRRLGLDLRAVEVPDHAFSILYNGTEHADVETTTARGFNPARDKAALEQFQEQTGFRYIPDKHRNQRREVREAGLVAIIYYNHGVLLSKEKRHHEALLAYFRAMSLDREFASAVKNALADLANWGSELSRKGKQEEALNVVLIGLELAPKDATLNHNVIYIYQEGGRNLLASGKPAEAAAWIDAGIKRFPDRPELKRLTGGIFINHSVKLIRAKDWLAAADALAAARAQVPDERGIRQNLGYLTQEWLKQAYAKEGSQKAEEVLATLLKRFPDLPEVKSAARGYYDTWAQDLAKRKDWQGAVDVYVKALERYPSDKQLVGNALATWDKWAKTFITVKDWAGAIKVYERALERFPDNKLLQKNLRYCKQQMQK